MPTHAHTPTPHPPSHTLVNVYFKTQTQHTLAMSQNPHSPSMNSFTSVYTDDKQVGTLFTVFSAESLYLASFIERRQKERMKGETVEPERERENRESAKREERGEKSRKKRGRENERKRE